MYSTDVYQRVVISISPAVVEDLVMCVHDYEVRPVRSMDCSRNPGAQGHGPMRAFAGSHSRHGLLRPCEVFEGRVLCVHEYEVRPVHPSTSHIGPPREHIVKFWRLFVTLGTALYPYGVAYRRVYGSVTVQPPRT